MLALCLLWVPAVFSQQYQDTTQLILSDLAALDLSISNVFSLLPEQVETARLSLATIRAAANRFSLSSGLAVALGTLLTIDVGVSGSDLSSLTGQELFFHAGTALYGYGFGAPFVLEGALEESDPGCGTEELQQVLENYPNLQNLPGTIYFRLESSLGGEDPYSLVEPRHLPHVKKFDLKSMILDVRDSLECLSGDSSVAGTITRLEDLIAERLSLTQRLMDNLHDIFYQNYNIQL